MIALRRARPDINQRVRRARLWSRALFLVWCGLALLTAVVLVVVVLEPGELLHIGRSDLITIAITWFLAELVVTLPILVVAAILGSRAEKLRRTIPRRSGQTGPPDVE